MDREIIGYKIIGYQIIDSKTGRQIGATYTYANRKRARSRAERLNLEYGAHRYSARPIFSEAA